jgi:hypothetical protein
MCRMREGRDNPVSVQQIALHKAITTADRTIHISLCIATFSHCLHCNISPFYNTAESMIILIGSLLAGFKEG